MKISISKTLKEMRKLPLEVSFEQVEEWVRRQPIVELKPRSRWMKWLIKMNLKRWNN